MINLHLSNQEVGFMLQAVNNTQMKGVVEAQTLVKLATILNDYFKQHVTNDESKNTIPYEVELPEDLAKFLVLCLDRVPITGLNSMNVVLGIAGEIQHQLPLEENKEESKEVAQDEQPK